MRCFGQNETVPLIIFFLRDVAALFPLIFVSATRLFPVRSAGQSLDAYCWRGAGSAMAKLNAHNKTKCRSVKIIGVNVRLVAGLLCYITFVAKDKDRDSPENFQALVLDFMHKITVMFCRLERKSQSLKGSRNLNADKKGKGKVCDENGVVGVNEGDKEEKRIDEVTMLEEDDDGDSSSSSSDDLDIGEIEN